MGAGHRNDKSYQLHRVQIHHYLGRSEPTFPLFGASIEEIDDLLEVSTFEDDGLTDLNSVTIIGVSKLETTFICINRKAYPVTQMTVLLIVSNVEQSRNFETIGYNWCVIGPRESVLRGISGVFFYLDDILITAPTDEVLVTILTEVLRRLAYVSKRTSASF